MRRFLALRLVSIPALVLAPVFMLGGCASATASDEPVDDPNVVAADELRAGGLENVVVQLSEQALGDVVERVERLEARGFAAAAVETFAVARVLEASRRAGGTSPQSSAAPLAVRPLGGYLWDHVKLNELEKALCRSKKVVCIKTLFVAQQAKTKAKALYADGENGGRMDAFRHSYWNARMVWVGGDAWAKSFADAHELGYPENETTEQGRLLGEMDYFNNAVGRTHGARTRSGDALVEALKAAIDAGELRAVRFSADRATGALVPTSSCTADAPCGL